MDGNRNQEPGERFRNILSSNDDEENTQFQSKFEPESEPQSQSIPQSLLDQLPHSKSSAQAPSQAEPKEPPPDSGAKTSSTTSNELPRGKKSMQDEQQAMEQPVTPAQQVSTSTAPDKPRGERFLRAFWTIASVFSLILNIVLIIILVIGLWAYRDIRIPESIDPSIANDLLNGLYFNFEKMDRATIETVIPVDAQIPLDITVPVQTTTQITLAETVNIPNAQVVINTGGLNINSTARVTLPAGTPLMVNLNFNLPVRDTIPVHLDVPVRIPMANTELHEPFVGLQDVVRPLYCLVDPNATNLDTQLICQ